MAYEESRSHLQNLLGPEALRRIIEQAHRGDSPTARQLAAAGISAAEIEAALDGSEVAFGFTESTTDGRSPILEAIILTLGRPSYVVRDDQVDWTTGAEFIADNIDFDGVVKPAIDGLAGCLRSIGRVNAANHPSLDWIGTAWLVETGAGLIAVTNRHVAQEFAVNRSGKAVFRYNRLMAPMGAWIDFKAEYERPMKVEAQVKGIRFLASDNQPDIALLEIEDTGALGARLRLSNNEAAAGDLIMTAGYPARDSRNPADVQATIFGEIFNVKRLAPGLIRQASGPGRTLQHDASTLGGASGSPLISLSDGHVVGLHFSGIFREKNAAVSVGSIKDALAGRLFALGQSMAPEDTEGRRDGEHPASHFDGRIGYQPHFLAEMDGVEAATDGLVVKLPTPPADELASLLDDPADHELRYTHFSVLYHEARRIPRLTAVNIDGHQAQKIKRGNDKWFADLRLPLEIQLTQNDFPGDFDRGHMVRREDPNWGTHEEAVLADSDTFHYTNAALQHALLNRNQERWLGLENYVLRSAQTYGFRASVFTGPILSEGDPFVAERDDLQVPLAFWKVVVMVAEDRARLHATGYLLGQADFVRTLTESFVFENFNTYQVPIAKISRQTGIDFHGLEHFDPLNSMAEREAVAGGVRPLESFDDIQF